jgi:tetratricopeptide (TPR) repeat protein
MTFQLRSSLSAAAVLAMFATGPAFSAGSGSDSPPAPTETTTKCEKGFAWDEKKQKCLEIVEGNLDNDTLFKAAREYAYFGRPEEALVALAAMTEGDTDRVLTYKGFANRKADRVEEGFAYYQAALEQNPDNLLVRSYMGQGYVEMGELTLAWAQLDEIVARGGVGTWAESSLRDAIATGVTYSF